MMKFFDMMNLQAYPIYAVENLIMMEELRSQLASHHPGSCSVHAKHSIHGPLKTGDVARLNLTDPRDMSSVSFVSANRKKY